MSDFPEDVFVIHMSTGYEDRRRHIETHLDARGIEHFEYVLEGDPSDITEANRDRLFYGQIRGNAAAMSCAYKHLHAFKRIVERKLDCALVLEDDAILVPRFKDAVTEYLNEVPSDMPFIVSFEETNTRVPIRLRKRGKHLYRAKDLQTIAGYVLNSEAACILVQALEDERSDWPIDSMLTRISLEKDIAMFRVEPPLIKQGSKNGVFHSTLSDRNRMRVFGNLRWQLTKWYHGTIVSNFSRRRRNLFVDERAETDKSLNRE